MADVISLKVIPEPPLGSRPVVSRESGKMLFIQGDQRAPALSCGRCDHILVRGVLVQCFTTAEKTSGGKAFKDGDQMIDGTLSVKGKHYFAGNTQPVLKCPCCGAYNETVASSTA
jgi:hypothetical protein